jgi:hypothetical protein
MAWLRSDDRDTRVSRQAKARLAESTKQLTGISRSRLQFLKYGHACSGRCRLCSIGRTLNKSGAKQKGCQKAQTRELAAQLAQDCA